LPRDGESRSLTTPREKLVKISTSVVRHWRYVVFQVASSASPKSMSRASPVYPADLDYDDTWGFVLGVQHAFADRWLSSLGGGYDTSPMSKSGRTPTLPMGRQFRLGTGIQYSFNDDITVGAVYEYMNAGDADLDRERGRSPVEFRAATSRTTSTSST
jgi:long-subunit fatty acid transport protein